MYDDLNLRGLILLFFKNNQIHKNVTFLLFSWKLLIIVFIQAIKVFQLW